MQQCFIFVMNATFSVEGCMINRVHFTIVKFRNYQYVNCTYKHMLFEMFQLAIHCNILSYYL